MMNKITNTLRSRKQWTEKERDAILDKVAKRYHTLQNLEPPVRLSWVYDFAWNMLFYNKNRICALTPLVGEKNIDFGLTDEGKKGYNPTMITFMDDCIPHDKMCEEADWINRNVLGWSVERAAEIIASSFKKEE